VDDDETMPRAATVRCENAACLIGNRPPVVQVTERKRPRWRSNRHSESFGGTISCMQAPIVSLNEAKLRFHQTKVLLLLGRVGEGRVCEAVPIST
jgi:hypothetical protein